VLVTVIVAAAGLSVSELAVGCDPDPPLPVLPPVLPPSVARPVPPVPVVGATALGLNPQPGSTEKATAARANGIAQKSARRAADRVAGKSCVRVRRGM
jgi:hypothetical protein